MNTLTPEERYKESGKAVSRWAKFGVMSGLLEALTLLKESDDFKKDRPPSTLCNCSICGKPTKSHKIKGEIFCHPCYIEAQKILKTEVNE